MCFPRTRALGRGSRWFYVRCASFIEIDLNLVEIAIFRRYLVILRGISIILVVFWSLWSVLGCLCFSTSGWLGCILGCICVFCEGVHKSALFDDIPGLFDHFRGHFRHFEVIWRHVCFGHVCVFEPPLHVSLDMWKRTLYRPQNVDLGGLDAHFRVQRCTFTCICDLPSVANRLTEKYTTLHRKTHRFGISYITYPWSITHTSPLSRLRPPTELAPPSYILYVVGVLILVRNCKDVVYAHFWVYFYVISVEKLVFARYFCS